MSSVPSAINSFAEGLLDKVAQQRAKDGSKQPAGVFISPFSIAQALGMLLQGAEGPAAPSYQQITAAVFGASEGNQVGLEALNAQLSKLTASLVKAPSADLTVADANSVWVRSGLVLNPAFKATLESVFAGDAQPITNAAAVNSWVSKATRGKITEIVDDGVLAQMSMILLNAVYFKGLWTHAFNKNATLPAPFHRLDGSSEHQTPMMHRAFKSRDGLRVAQLTATLPSGGAPLPCQLVRLPYKGDEYSAIAAMPLGDLSSNDGQLTLSVPGETAATVPYTQALAACRSAVLSGLASATALPQQLGGGAAAVAANASEAIGWQAAEETVKLWLPRFEIEFSTLLNAPLQALGITAPFRPGDFTRLATEASGVPVGDLYVDSVIHKVYVKADEEGTEAAAVTGIMMMRSALPRPQAELLVRFDRPFTFVILHEPSRVVLFAGEVVEPEEAKAPQA